MLIYTGTKQQFDEDVLSNHIASKIVQQFKIHGVHHENAREFVSWGNSLHHMQTVLDDPAFDSDINVAVEYQIP